MMEHIAPEFMCGLNRSEILRGKFGRLTPEDMFDEFTLLGDLNNPHPFMQELDDFCKENNHTAHFAYCPKWGQWVFYELDCLIASKALQKGIARADIDLSTDTKHVVSVPEGEKGMTLSIASRLRAKSRDVTTFVRSPGGEADIVTEDAIYEVKEKLKRDAIYKAVGQLFLYATALNISDRQKVIIGRWHSDSELLKAYCLALGIKMEIYHD